MRVAEIRKPVKFYFSKRNPFVSICRDRYDLWRGVANVLSFKAHTIVRVEWMVFYYTVGEENATPVLPMW
jgi:hypothetical protein